VPGLRVPGFLGLLGIHFPGRPGAGLVELSVAASVPGVSRSSFACLIELGCRGIALPPSGLVAPSRTGQGLRPTGRATGVVRDRSSSTLPLPLSRADWQDLCRPPLPPQHLEQMFGRVEEYPTPQRRPSLIRRGGFSLKRDHLQLPPRLRLH